MYVIIVYDVDADRTHIPRKFLRQYLNHVQDSVFEGKITEGQVAEIKEFLTSEIRSDESVFIYTMWGEKYLDKTILGDDPMEESTIL